jgi:hypothetical protein
VGMSSMFEAQNLVRGPQKGGVRGVAKSDVSGVGGLDTPPTLNHHLTSCNLHAAFWKSQLTLCTTVSSRARCAGEYQRCDIHPTHDMSKLVLCWAGHLPRTCTHTQPPATGQRGKQFACQTEGVSNDTLTSCARKCSRCDMHPHTTWTCMNCNWCCWDCHLSPTIKHHLHSSDFPAAL